MASSVTSTTYTADANADGSVFWKLPARGVLRRETSDVIASVVDAPGKQTLTLDVEQDFRPTRQERLVLRTPWGPELQALLNFDAPPRGGRVQASISALFSRDRGILESFVTEVLGGPAQNSRFGARGAGWYLWMESRRAATEQRAKQQPEEDQGRRKEPRVPVRVAVTCAVEGRLIKARAYNISRTGLYLLAKLAKDRLPPKGSIVRVRYPVTVHIKPVELVITGKLCWCHEGTNGKDVYGLGLAIESWNDASDEAIWSRYVMNELDFRPDRVRVVTEKQS